MDKNEIKYIPCLRWKQGEYQAVLTLKNSTKKMLLPIIEVPEIGYDFENQKNNKTIDEHLEPFTKRIIDKWGKEKCFIDIKYIEEYPKLKSGQPPVERIFNELRAKGVHAIPITRINQDNVHKKNIKEVTNIDKYGLCIRVDIEDIDEPNFSSNIQELLNEFGLNAENCDFIIDLSLPDNDLLKPFSNVLTSIITDLPFLDKWRTFGIIANSFPSSLSPHKGLFTIPRNEWQLYKLLYKKLKQQGARIPNFGDYTINNPEVQNYDMRFIKPCANVRYTSETFWVIARGDNVRDNGYGIFVDLCDKIVKSGYFIGDTFSFGDKYIYDCANNPKLTGNLTTWRKVGTNHHIEFVIQQLSTFFSS